MKKIKTRDVGLLACGFIIGAVVTAALITTTTTTSTQRSSPPPSTLVLTAPTLVSAPVPPTFISVTNIQPQARPGPRAIRPRVIDSFDSQTPLYPPPHRSVDLIDTHFQPNIKLDDLK